MSRSGTATKLLNDAIRSSSVQQVLRKCFHEMCRKSLLKPIRALITGRIAHVIVKMITMQKISLIFSFMHLLEAKTNTFA